MGSRTRGASALATWLAREERSQQWLADQLEKLGFECHQSTVSAWLHGKWVPPLRAVVAIHEITGIEIASWTEESEPSGSLPPTGTA